MLIFWFYTSHFKLILGKSYLKSLHKGQFLKKFFTLWNTRILEKIHLATMYISISVPKSQIRSLCENGGGLTVFQIWCSPYPRPICQEYEIIMTISKQSRALKFTSQRPQICLTQGKMFSSSLDETIPIEKKRRKKNQAFKKYFPFFFFRFYFGIFTHQPVPFPSTGKVILLNLSLPDKLVNCM